MNKLMTKVNELGHRHTLYSDLGTHELLDILITLGSCDVSFVVTYNNRESKAIVSTMDEQEADEVGGEG